MDRAAGRKIRRKDDPKRIADPSLSLAILQVLDNAKECAAKCQQHDRSVDGQIDLQELAKGDLLAPDDDQDPEKRID